MISLLCSFLCTLFIFKTGFSQNKEKVFIRTSATTTSQAVVNVRKIVKDKYGFLWLGTQDGLYRADSRGFTVYNTDASKNHLLGGPDITDIILDRSGNIWVSTSSGSIDKIEVISGNRIFHTSISSLSSSSTIIVTSLCDLGEKIIIGSNKGLFSLSKNDSKLMLYNFISPEINSDSLIIEKIFPFKNLLILLCKDKGVVVIDAQQNAVVEVVDAKSFKSKSEDNFIRFFDVSRISASKWAVATSDGLHFLEINDFGSAKISTGANSATSLPVFAVSYDGNGNLFLSGENNLYKFNITTSEQILLSSTKDVGENDNLKSVYSILAEQDNVWLGCQNGFFYFRNRPAEFITFHNSANSTTKIDHTYFIFPLNDSLIYATAESGLYMVNQHTNQIDALDESKVYDFMFKDPANRIIVSNRKGLFVMSGNQMHPIDKDYKEFADYADYRVNSAIAINDECIAMGTENYRGILVWNHVLHTVENFTKNSQPGLEEDVTNNLFFMEKNRFCILGDDAFVDFSYTSRTAKAYHFKKDGDGLCNLYFDMCSYKGKYYIASYGNGVLRLNKKLEQERLFSTKDGLSNNGVYKLLPWKDSLLFITTNSGLSLYNVFDSSFKKYYKTDGLNDDSFEETSGNSHNNILYAGGANGFTVVYPLNIKPNNIPPNLYFNKLHIELPGGKKIDTSNLEAKLYIIPNNAIQTTIQFSGINFSNPERTMYAYRITEQSKDWINLSTQNFVTLIGLVPGTYHLQVKVANEDGVWSDPKELVLEFLPKWYQTWWFNLLVILTTAGIIYALYRYRISQIRKQHEIRKNIATDLHDDLGSTLNSVKVFTNLAISGVNQNESLHQIKDNLKEATMGLRDMIWVLDDSLDTVDELVTRLKQFTIPVASASNIEAHITADTEINNRHLTKEEKRNLFLVCKEAINNSIKYSGASQINVTIVPAHKKIKITITDNGKGFDMEEVKKGYGLKNMQYRAGQVKYKTIINSVVGQGTILEIRPA